MSDCTEEIRDALARKLNSRQRRELEEATARQKEIARANQGRRRSVDGLGAPVMEVDSKVYHAWGRKEGYDVWRDPKFRKRMAEKHPELLTKAGGTGRTQVGYGG